MLKLEERFMIKELYREGNSISEIARQTGCDRKTVRTILQQPLAPAAKGRRPKSRKIDPFVLFRKSASPTAC